MEYVVLVNDQNEQIGVMEKLAAHNANTPLHRAFSCYIFNEEGEFLLTQRASTKKVFPDIWTNSCCGHPGPDETTEDAIRRRMQDELDLQPKKLKLIVPDYRYQAEMNGIMENEICPVYIATVSKDPQLNFDEVKDYTWITWEGFLNRMEKAPMHFSPWCREQASLLNIDKKFLKIR